MIGPVKGVHKLTSLLSARRPRNGLPWAVLFLTSLSCDVPRDPEGAYGRVRSGTMRVGVTANEPWTRFEKGRPAGIEVELLEQFAQQLHARIAWSHDSESQLFQTLQGGGLEVVIGGLTDATPWSNKVGLTQPYLEIQGQKHVMATQQGENRWLLELDRFLQSHRGAARELYRQEVGP